MEDGRIPPSHADPLLEKAGIATLATASLATAGSSEAPAPTAAPRPCLVPIMRRNA